MLKFFLKRLSPVWQSISVRGVNMTQITKKKKNEIFFIHLIDSIDTSPEELLSVSHLPGVQCRCRVCEK